MRIRKYLVFIYEVVDQVLVPPDRYILVQLGFGPVEPVIQSLQGVSEPA